MQKMGYRDRIYEKYASIFKEEAHDFNVAAAERAGKAYAYYFRDYLPSRKDTAILDLACGSGRLLYYFKRQGYANLTGVDISTEQVRLAKQVVGNIVEGDANDFLKAHAECFDLITGIDVIEHLRKDEALELIDHCYASLKLGGWLILQTLNAESPWAITMRYGDFTHEISFTPHLLSSLLTMSGFSEVSFREQGPIPWGYSLRASARYLMWRVFTSLLQSC